MWVAQVHYPSCMVNAYLVSSSASIPQMCGIHVWGSAIFQREKLKEWSATNDVHWSQFFSLSLLLFLLLVPQAY